MSSIKLKDITMKFGEIIAVKDIDLDVRDGEYLTILGPSGCGKTTLIKVIAGMYRPTDGRVYVDGEDITDVPMEDRDIGYVFQNIALFPHMNIRENTEYGLRVRDVPMEERAPVSDMYLELVNMLDRAGMFPDELSGGEQQKVALARALSSGSKILMLDEPMSALDARVRMDLRYEIRRIVKKLGLTVLHVTHDQEEAMSVSDRIILMKKGKINEIGTPLSIYRNPRTIFAANFIGETNLIECVVTAKSRTGKTMVMLRDGSRVRVSRSEFRVGDPVVISVRPEHVYTSSEGLRAVVIDKVFMGSYWRIRTEADSEDYIDYNISTDSDVPEMGEEVFLVFNKKASVVFARPEYGIEEEIRLE